MFNGGVESDASEREEGVVCWSRYSVFYKEATPQVDGIANRIYSNPLPNT